MAAQLTINQSEDTLALVGEIDTHTAPQLEATLNEVDSGSSIVLDLAGVTFISSAGLTAMLTTQERLRSAGGDLLVANPVTAEQRMFELSGLTDLLNAG